MEKFQVVGWDNGYDFEKLVVGKEEDRKVLYPSVIHKPSKMVDLTAKNGEYDKDNMVIEFNDKIYIVGDYAIHTDPLGGTKNYEKDKFNNDSEIAKLLAGLALFSEEEEIIIKKLSVGLPIGIFNDLKGDLKNRLADKVFKFEINDTERMVTVQDVMVMPQGVGGFYNSTLDFKGRIEETELLNKRYGLIDIGGNTVDMFVGERLKPANNSQIQLSAGISDAFKSINNDAYILIEKAFIEGKDEFTYGDKKYKDIVNECNKEFSKLAENIYMSIRDQWNRQIDRIEVFVLIGGGAKVLGEYLEDLMIKRLDKQVVIIDNPIFANALGYYKLGIYQKVRERVDGS